MSLVIYNAHVVGYNTLVKVTCDSETHCITSVEPQVRKSIVRTFLRRSGVRDLASVVSLRRASDKTILIDAGGSLLIPGLVQAHLHLSQAYFDEATSIYDNDVLYSKTGLAFVGALSDTRSFLESDYVDDRRKSSVLARIKLLMDRGRNLIETSLTHGVTSMRAQVEVDAHVGHLPLHAACALQEEFEDRCDIRISVFASQSIFCEPDRGFDQDHLKRMRWLLRRAVEKEGVRAVGSDPFSEDNDMAVLLNIRYMLDLAETSGVDVEFHLDFDITEDDRITTLLQEIRQRIAFRSDFWSPDPSHERLPLRVTIAHYGRLSSLPTEAKSALAEIVAGWEIYFVSLSYESKGFLRRTGASAFDGFQHEISEHGWAVPDNLESSQIGSLVKDLDAHTSLAFESIGDLTSHWDIDPLALLTVDAPPYPHGLSETQAQNLLRMITLNAAAAAGMGKRAHPRSLQLRKGDTANLVLLDGCFDCKMAVLNPPYNRVTIKRGEMVSGSPTRMKLR